jgi:diguanylate cyclase (GGDEF)-like protein/PAS domain S-box-containing protein
LSRLRRPRALPSDPRRARVAAYGLEGDAPAEAAFEDLVRRAREATGVSVAWLSVFDGECERLIAAAGLARCDLSREESFAFCGQARLPCYVEDARRSGFAAHPWVTSGPAVRFVAAVPLAAPDGLVVGSLTLLDRVVRKLSAHAITAVENLATLAVARLEARRADVAPHGPAQRAERPAGIRAGIEGELALEKDFSSAVIESFPGAFWLVSADGVIVRWNRRLAAVTGYSDAEIGSMQPLDFISGRDRAAVDAAMRRVLGSGEEIALEAEIVDRAGNVRPYSISGKPLRLGGRNYMIGLGSDITLKRRAEQQMARAKERLDLALSSSSLALWDWDLRLERVYFNENWRSIRGEAPEESTFSAAEVVGWTHPDDRDVFRAALGNATKGVSEEFDCEYRVANAGGEWIWVHSRGKVTQRDASGAAARMTGTSMNVTKRKIAEERAEYLATRDALTGLPNRVLLHDRLEQAVVNAARLRAGFGFMFIDLDRFKTINDSLGHHVGDALLKQVAARLGACVRASDTVARLGGDEFAVILENLRDDDHEGAQQVAEKMIETMSAPLLIEGQHLNTSCSIGISVYPTDGKDTATLMKHADAAMYYAKEKGRNNYQFFSADMNARAQERLSVENYLRLALRRHELVLEYQPRVSFATGELLGVEALLRWQHPRRGLLMPDAFIEVAEDSGLIVPIGEWVLESACDQIAAWQRGIHPGLRLSVNLSVGQVVDGERLYSAVERVLQRTAIDPRTLELELTESLLMQNLRDKAALLNRLGALGVSLSIDDFGTGYSSLAYLRSLPVDAIKIDGSFVRHIPGDANDMAIVSAIVAMAHSLHLKVVAEGVESREQYEALRGIGCDEYQGFLESAALGAAELESRYRR